MTRIYEVGDTVEFLKAGDNPGLWPAGLYAKVVRSDDWVLVQHPTAKNSSYLFKPLDPSMRRVPSASAGADGWITWAGGECPVPGDTVVEVRFRNGHQDTRPAHTWNACWRYDSYNENIVAYRVITQAASTVPLPVTMEPDDREHTGGSVSYYSIAVEQPTSGGESYTAECNDLIEALGLNYAEGNVLKAVWRIAAARLGKSKRGYDDAQYDAEKIMFFGNRMLAMARAQNGVA